MYKRYRRRTITLLTIVAVIFISLSSFAVVRLLKNGRIGVDLNIYMEDSEPTNQKEDVELFVSKLNSDLENGKVVMKDGTYEIESINFSSTLFKPDLGWLNVSNNEVSEYSFYFFNSEEDATSDIDLTKYYSNCYVQKINDQIIYEELTTNKVINVKDFGATGDISKHLANTEALDAIQNPTKVFIEEQVVDGEFFLSDYQKAAILETNAIQKAVEEVNKTGGILYFPYGTYSVIINNFNIDWDTKCIFTVQSEKQIIIELGMSTIKQLGLANPYNFPDTRLFMIQQSENVEIKNGTLIGDRREHDYSNWTFNDQYKHLINDVHERIYGIHFDFVRNGRAYNLKVTEFPGDAILVSNTYVGNPDMRGYYTYIEDCELSYCRRQGISFLDSDENYIKNCSIHDIGHSAMFGEIIKNDKGEYIDGTTGPANGASPMCGIDVEPDSGAKRVDLLEIDGTTIYSCSNKGIISDQEIYNGRIEVVVKNSEIENPSIADTTFENSTIIFNDYISTDGATAMTGLVGKNTTFKFHNKHKFSLYLTNGVLDSCKFISDTTKIIDEKEENVNISLDIRSGAKNYDKVQAVNFDNLNNLTFKNIKGYMAIDKNTGLPLQGYGVNITNGKLENGVFENCSVQLTCGELTKSKLTDSLVFMFSHTEYYGTYTDVEFYNCNFDLNARAGINFKSCKLYDGDIKLGYKTECDFLNCEFLNCIGKFASTAVTSYLNCIFNKCSGFPTVTQ